MTVRPAMRRLRAGLAVAALALGLVGCGDNEEPAATGTGEAAEAGAACDFYQGETLRIIVPYNPGGGYDAFVRALAPLLEDQVDGLRVRVENQPGAGGLVGANNVFKAEPDGLTIGLINYPGAVFAQASDREGVELDNSEWTIIGRLGAINPVMYTGADTDYTDFQSVLDAQEPVVFGLGGVGSDAYYATIVTAGVLGFPHEIVAGYPGSAEADAALLAGEVDASVNSGGAAVAAIEAGAHPVVFISTEPNPELPDVPTITEFGDAEQQQVLTSLASLYDLERTLVAPPGVPEDRAECLGEAILAAASEPAYAEEVEAAGYAVNVLGREETAQLAEEATAAVEELTPLIQQ